MGLSCMNACMEPFLKYSETIFKEMLMYMIIIYQMLMICMCHMDDLISENLVSKLQERICGILFHHNQFDCYNFWYKHVTVAVIQICSCTVNNGHWTNGVIVYLTFLWCIHCYSVAISCAFILCVKINPVPVYYGLWNGIGFSWI